MTTTPTTIAGTTPPIVVDNNNPPTIGTTVIPTIITTTATPTMIDGTTLPPDINNNARPSTIDANTTLHTPAGTPTIDHVSILSMLLPCFPSRPCLRLHRTDQPSCRIDLRNPRLPTHRIGLRHPRRHSGTQQITKFPNNSGTSINIVSKYGQITMTTLQTECETFCLSTGPRYTE